MWRRSAQGQHHQIEAVLGPVPAQEILMPGLDLGHADGPSRIAMGIEYDGIDRGMDVHVSRIRRKLQRSGFDSSRLKSVRGVGYLLASR